MFTPISQQKIESKSFILKHTNTSHLTPIRSQPTRLCMITVQLLLQQNRGITVHEFGFVFHGTSHRHTEFLAEQLNQKIGLLGNAE